MPITNISIENFKGIGKRVDIPIRPITLLFGANSAGKSTILQALLYLRHVLENREPIKVNADKLEVSGESIDLGGFSQFVHNRDTSKEVVIGVTVTVDDDGLPKYTKAIKDMEDPDLNGVETATIRVGVKSLGNRNAEETIYANRYEVDLNGVWMTKSLVTDSPENYELNLNSEHPLFDGKIMDPEFEDDWEPSEDTEHLWKATKNPQPTTSVYEHFKQSKNTGEGFSFRNALCIPEPNKSADESSKLIFMGIGDNPFFEELIEVAQYQINQILLGPMALVYSELKFIRYLGGIRELPTRSLNKKLTNDPSRWSNGLAAWDLLQTKEIVSQEPVVNALNELGLECKFDLKQFYKIPLESTIGTLPFRSDESHDEDFIDECKREINEAIISQELILSSGGTNLQVNDVGLGVSQVLPVVVGAYSDGFSVMSVEQPELHIHPAVQCKLADLLAHSVLGKRKHKERSLILETHSEHLMLRLLRRIREKHEGELQFNDPEIGPEDISVLYIEKDQGEVKITHLPITEDGDFEKKWPKGFFEERTEELF